MTLSFYKRRHRRSGSSNLKHMESRCTRVQSTDGNFTLQILLLTPRARMGLGGREQLEQGFIREVAEILAAGVVGGGRRGEVGWHGGPFLGLRGVFQPTRAGKRTRLVQL